MADGMDVVDDETTTPSPKATFAYEDYETFESNLREVDTKKKKWEGEVEVAFKELKSPTAKGSERARFNSWRDKKLASRDASRRKMNVFQDNEKHHRTKLKKECLNDVEMMSTAFRESQLSQMRTDVTLDQHDVRIKDLELSIKDQKVHEELLAQEREREVTKITNRLESLETENKSLKQALLCHEVATSFEKKLAYVAFCRPSGVDARNDWKDMTFSELIKAYKDGIESSQVRLDRGENNVNWKGMKKQERDVFDDTLEDLFPQLKGQPGSDVDKFCNDLRDVLNRLKNACNILSHPKQEVEKVSDFDVELLVEKIYAEQCQVDIRKGTTEDVVERQKPVFLAFGRACTELKTNYTFVPDTTPTTYGARPARRGNRESRTYF